MAGLRHAATKKSRLWQTLGLHVLFLICAFALSWAVMRLVTVPGADWYTDFAQFRYAVYPPWIAVVMWPVRSLTTQNALTTTALGYALWRSKAKPVHYLLAFTAMPLYWNLWLGQQEYIPLFGLLWLPWGLPLAAIKPQIAMWGVAAWWLWRPDRNRIALAAVAALGVSLLVYGWWPGRLTLPVTFDSVYNLSTWQWIGWVGGTVTVVAAAWVTLRTRDMDRAMALGALASPYVQGNSYLLLLPALTRLSGWTLLFVWASSWGALAALNFGDSARPLMWLFPVTLWGALTYQAGRSSSAGLSVLQQPLAAAQPDPRQPARTHQGERP